MLRKPSFRKTLVFKRLRGLFEALLHRHGTRHGSTHHGVVAHADEAHHLHVGGHGGGARELGVAVHTAHGIGQTVGSRAGGHIVGMQGAAGAAAGSDGERCV